MVIDTNVYYLPELFFTDEKWLNHFSQAIESHQDTHVVVTKENGQTKIVIEKPIGQPSLDYFQNDYTMTKMIADLDEAQVDLALLKTPGCQEWMDLDLCHIYNEEVAKFVSESQGRLKALAVVPPYDTKENLAELDHAIDDLHLSGIQLSAHYEEGYLDEEAYRGFLKYVAQKKIPVYVHHTPVPMEYESIKKYENVRRSYGRCADQIIAISREVFSDLFEECPDLVLIHSMLGGGYFTYKMMFLPHDSGNGRFEVSASDLIKGRLEKNIAYEMSHAQPWGKDNLEIAIKVLSPHNVIYGSSYPVKKSWLVGGPQMIKDLDVSDEIKENVLFQNAKRFYKL